MPPAQCRIKGQHTFAPQTNRAQKRQKSYSKKEMISLCVSLYCRRPSNVRRPFLWFFCFHHFSLTHARRRINDIRIIICVDPQVSASSQLPRTYFEATNAFANILKRRKNCFRLYTIGMRSVAREVECTQARRSARSCELYWMSFTFNFVCI